MAYHSSAMAGASSGSLIACLAKSMRRPDVALEATYQLSRRHLEPETGGAFGIWRRNSYGNWLDGRLVTLTMHELVSGRLHVIIAKAPTQSL
jgi:predicted acylesterase/phospholipase RssA